MTPLYALILAGGQSQRMGSDKGLLAYHGKPQRFYLADLLGMHCDRALIAVNAHQTQTQTHSYDYIVDNPRYADHGPIAVLLNAHERYPHAAWFVVSCDLPFFDEWSVRALMDQRDQSKSATAFLIHEINQPEPLVTIYEQKFLRALRDQFNQGANSLRKLLARADVQLIRDYDPNWTLSVDDPSAYRATLARM
jgi:molybdopterin-guanine dinucleotide biosynthesis protein A